MDHYEDDFTQSTLSTYHPAHQEALPPQAIEVDTAQAQLQLRPQQEVARHRHHRLRRRLEKSSLVVVAASERLLRHLLK